jgi:hypothetical protein
MADFIISGSSPMPRIGGFQSFYTARRMIRGFEIMLCKRCLSTVGIGGENGYSIIARYEDGTEETHMSGIRTRKLAELALAMAEHPVRYDNPQLKLDL